MSENKGDVHDINENMNNGDNNEINSGIVSGGEKPKNGIGEGDFNNNLGGGVNNNNGDMIRENDDEIDMGAEEGDGIFGDNDIENNHNNDLNDDVNNNNGNEDNKISDELDLGLQVEANGSSPFDNFNDNEHNNDENKELEDNLDKGDSSESIENSDDKLSKNDGTDKEDGKEKGAKQVKTNYGLYITQIFGTFGPALGALSGPVGLLLIVYVLPKSTKMLLPMSSHNSEKDGIDKINMKDGSTANLNSDYKGDMSNNKIIGGLASIGSGPKKNTVCLGQGSLNKQDILYVDAKTSSEIMKDVKKAEDIFEDKGMKDILDKGTAGLKKAYSDLLNNKEKDKNPELLVNFLTELVKPENVNIIKGINKEFGNNGLGDQMKEVNKILQEQMQEVFKNEDLQDLIKQQYDGNLPEFYNDLTEEKDFDKFCEGLADLNKMLGEKDKGEINVEIGKLVTEKFKEEDGVKKLLGSLEKFGISSSDATLRNPPSCPNAGKGDVIRKLL